jgi:hypothetical protein
MANEASVIGDGARGSGEQGNQGDAMEDALHTSFILRRGTS